MKTSAAAFFVAAAAAASGATVAGAADGIDTVDPPNLAAFLGRWYQMYGSASSTLLTFGNTGPQDTCVSADYALDDDGSTIRVLNQGLRGSDGVVTKIEGTATATERPGQRKLRFDKFLRGEEEVQPPDFEGDYWIYRLGPTLAAKDGGEAQYAYAIVGGPLNPSLGWDRTQLFVLARDPTTFKQKYDQEVLEWTEANGFTRWWNRPRATGSQGPFRWFPYPRFGDGDGGRGEFGQDGCAAVDGLEPPRGGGEDPRTSSGRLARQESAQE